MNLGQRLKKQLAQANPKLAEALELEESTQQQEPKESVLETAYWNKVHREKPEQIIDKGYCIKLLGALRNEVGGKLNTENQPYNWSKVSDIYARLVSSHLEIDLGIEGYNPKKGLIIIGTVGTGKTDAVKHCRSVFMPCLMFNAKKIAGTVQMKKDSAVLEPYMNKKHLFIDDIGSESAVQLYGNSIEVVADLVESDRYNLFLQGFKTYATTNLSGKDFFERYDQRVLDRFKQMFNVFVLQNKESFR